MKMLHLKNNFGPSKRRIKPINLNYESAKRRSYRKKLINWKMFSKN